MSKPQTEPEATQALAVELRILIGKLTRKLREQSTTTGDFTSSQRSVLSRLDREGPATVTTLARDMGMRSQSMGATVSSLEAAGLVSGAPDPGDGRQTIWSLTPACKKMIKTNRAAREDWLLHAIQTKIAPNEHKDLANAVDLLKRLAES